MKGSVVMKGSAGQHLFYHALRPRKDPRRRASPPFVDAAHFSCDAEAQENRQPDVMQRAIVVEIPLLCTDGW
jgi:hypothetical protein